ncbi:MAG: hypothetical protein ACFCVK_06435 [Acidimicrobiales bacterium]
MLTLSILPSHNSSADPTAPASDDVILPRTPPTEDHADARSTLTTVDRQPQGAHRLRAGHPAPSRAVREVRRSSRRLDISRSAWDIGAGRPLTADLHAVGVVTTTTVTETWLAWSAHRSSSVILRIPRRRPLTRLAADRLIAERDALAAAGGEGFAPLLGDHLDRPLPLLVLGHLPGAALSSLFGTGFDGTGGGRRRIVDAVTDVARALAVLHDGGRAHLDLDPDRIVLGPSGAVVTAADAALAVGVDPLRFYRGDRRFFTAPEQLRGHPAAAAMDVFALGALLYRALGTRTGAPGSVFRNVGPGRTALRPLSELAPDTPNSIVELVERMMDPQPQGRPSAVEAAEALAEPDHPLPVPPAPGAEGTGAPPARCEPPVGAATDTGSD